MKYAVFDAEDLPLGFYAVGDIWPIEKIRGRHRNYRGAMAGVHQQPQHTQMAWRRGGALRSAGPGGAVPVLVSAAQAKIALSNAGLLDEVEAAISVHPYRAVRIWCADANQWERGHPYVQAIGAELGLAEQAIDDLFVAASRL
jgi:hypothetical protein